MKTIRFGMIGLDTSHVSAFAKVLHNPEYSAHGARGKVVAAFAGGSPDLPVSINRVEGFTNDLRDNHGVEIVDSICDLAGKCDAILLHSVDGRVHLEQFRQVVGWKLPVFIDKPLAVSSADAREIARLAKEHGTPVLTASAIRFGEAFQRALAEGAEDGPILGGDFHGPVAFVENVPGYFWYGIHTADMLFATLGRGCREVSAIRTEKHDIITGRWEDGRLGVLRGNRAGNNTFSGTIHREKKSIPFSLATSTKPYYESLLDELMRFAQGAAPAIDFEESVEVIRFLEAANESAETGKPVAL